MPACSRADHRVIAASSHRRCASPRARARDFAQVRTARERMSRPRRAVSRSMFSAGSKRSTEPCVLMRSPFRRQRVEISSAIASPKARTSGGSAASTPPRARPFVNQSLAVAAAVASAAALRAVGERARRVGQAVDRAAAPRAREAARRAGRAGHEASAAGAVDGARARGRTRHVAVAARAIDVAWPRAAVVDAVAARAILRARPRRCAHELAVTGRTVLRARWCRALSEAIAVGARARRTVDTAVARLVFSRRRSVRERVWTRRRIVERAVAAAAVDDHRASPTARNERAPRDDGRRAHPEQSDPHDHPVWMTVAKGYDRMHT